MFKKVWRQRRSSATMFGGLVVIVALAGVVAGGAQAAKPGNAQAAKACQKGGFEDLARSEDYSGFSSEEECVSYAAQGGTLVNLLALCKQQLADAGLTAPANANYILGTLGNDNFTGQLTSGNDVICGFAGNDQILPDGSEAGVLRAGDIFLGGNGSDYVQEITGGIFNGGGGNDTVSGMGGGTFNGGDGNDSVWIVFRGTFNGGDGNESVGFVVFGTFNGGDGCDTVAVDTNQGGTVDLGDQSSCTT